MDEATNLVVFEKISATTTLVLQLYMESQDRMIAGFQHICRKTNSNSTVATCHRENINI